ncbi:tigger transposable element-derived protein 1-like [Varanus komodoensis]|uniref:tigger transposable element-derived protein 1-like n=1 Tax=Varanus komodoensis TaxID=61221 RepID=UPI001CF7EC36|nr:tigger transposable element-derived protein 1-like [Varanus komodoensis]
MAEERGDLSALGAHLKATWKNGMKLEEVEPPCQEARKGHIAIQAGDTRGFWERTDPQELKQEPDERQQCWEAQLQGFVRALELPHLHGVAQPAQEYHGVPVPSDSGEATDPAWQPTTERKVLPGLCVESHVILPGKEQPGCGSVKEEEIPDRKTPVAELQRQRFRHFSYQEAEGPRDVCQRLQELCHQWLMPETRTKEQIVELVVLEQFLAILPREIRSRIKALELETCSQAVVLVEGLLQQKQRQEEGDGQETARGAVDLQGGARSPSPGRASVQGAHAGLSGTQRRGAQGRTCARKSMEAKKPKRKVVISTIAVKKELIAKYESGVRVADLAAMFKMPKSTVCTILKNKEAIKAANVAKGVTTLTSRRSHVIEEMEQLLLVWINEKRLAGDIISEKIICEKAKQLYSDLKKCTPGTSAESEEFKGSRGWFAKFRKRTGIRSVVMHGEAAGANVGEAEKFAKSFQQFVEREGFVPQQVFNCDETGLFWKRVPRGACVTDEEEAVPGPRPMEDRLTLLLCGNASGDCKVKPLLVYHSENPRVLRKHGVMKTRLGVMWRVNERAWVTRRLFTEWIHEVFAPSVRAYLAEKNLPRKALLVMDSAPAHPPGLEEELVGESGFIKVMFLPSNVTSLIQPMDQQVIANFKKLYTKAMFQRCFEATSETELTLGDFWKGHYNLLDGLRVIDKAWREVSLGTMQSAWKKLWPDCISARDCEDFEPAPVVNEIVALGKAMGLEVSEEDVEELVEDHKAELTIEELQHLHDQQQEDLAEEISSEEEEGAKRCISSAEIKELCSVWARTQAIVEKWHPNAAVVNRSINFFNDNVMAYFRNIQKSHQHQPPLESFFSGEKRPSEAKSSTSNAKKQKRERTPEDITTPH